MNYYIADTHFGHENIIKHCNRPFESAKEMDAVMMQNWNAVVTDKDTVYVIGDFAFRGANWKEYASKLKGKKVFLNGNHDKFEEPVPDMMTVKDDGDRIVLCHYPIVEWDGFYRGALHFFGHIHNNRNQAYELMKQVNNAYNVGADLLALTPRTKKQIVEMGKRQEEQSGFTMKIESDHDKIEQDGVFSIEAFDSLVRDICLDSHFYEISAGHYGLNENEDEVGSMLVLDVKFKKLGYIIPNLKSWTTYSEEEGEVDQLA